MGIDTKQFKMFVVIPTLTKLDLYSEAAVNLLLGTCAQESKMGRYLKQINGPALGPFEMQENDHNDAWDSYLNFRPDLARKVLSIGRANALDLITNLAYATAMARIHYLRVEEPLPQANDIPGLARYYKQHYNTPAGAATVEEFITNYQALVNME